VASLVTSFSRFGRADKQTHRRAHTDADEHVTPATLVGVNNYSMHLSELMQ